jgi:hypothetical protein
MVLGRAKVHPYFCALSLRRIGGEATRFDEYNGHEAR